MELNEQMQISYFNKLRPWQNDHHLADDTFRRIFLNENLKMSLKISPKFVPEGAINIIHNMLINRCITDIYICCLIVTQLFSYSWWLAKLNLLPPMGRSHYNDVIVDSMASQITSLTIVYSAVYSCADQRKHQSSASLAFVRGNHRWPVNSPQKWPVTRKMLPFDDVIMDWQNFIFYHS